MYYVIQVASGMEDKVEEQIGVLIGKELYGRCFHPIRHVKKKIRGEWRELKEKLLPGYVFIVSDNIEELYLKLRYVPAFTKLLGKEAGQFVPLPEHEVKWLERITDSINYCADRKDKNSRNSRNDDNNSVEVPLSQVSISENDVITILSGPLKNVEGDIKKIDLHRRIAKVEIDFMNRKTVVHLGIEMVEKISK